MHRVSKGAPEQILNLVHNKSYIEGRVHSVIDKFAERGLRSLGVAYQEVPDGTKESAGGPWQLIALLPLFDPPRHDSAETIRRALNLGVSVKMITGYGARSRESKIWWKRVKKVLKIRTVFGQKIVKKVLKIHGTIICVIYNF